LSPILPPDVKPGNARVKECLEDKRSDPEFSAECKKTFEEMMERRATDFRLDAKLRDLCKVFFYSTTMDDSFVLTPHSTCTV
jgi:hypothetical protein